MRSITGAAAELGGKVLRVDYANGQSARYHAMWLRDNAQDSETRASGNGQRLITLGDIDRETVITKTALAEGDVDLTFAPENRAIRFRADWLAENRYDRWAKRAPGWTDEKTILWDAGHQGNLTSDDFDDLGRNAARLRDWLDGVRRYGVAKITNGPIKSGALIDVANLFGYVRETNYGRWFEVRTEVNPTNLAFTGLGLQAHTDNPYRDPVPTLQILYCLESTAKGGDSMVVDGFCAVQKLQAEDAAAFDVLANHCARFEYAGEAGVQLRTRLPMINLAPDGELIGIRFNNRSAAPIVDVPFDTMESYYSAYRRLGEIIDDPAMAVSFRLDPGDCFIVDNTRVLHARNGYSGVGSRWLQGCYADKDGLLSQLATLEQAP